MMTSKAIWMGLAAVSMVTSAALAADLTERMMSERMTVVKVDRTQGRFLCAEHHRWTRIAKTDVAVLSSGDIVTVTRTDKGPARVTVVRTAVDELTSPEN